MNRNKLDEIFESTPSPTAFAGEYAAYLAEVLSRLDYAEIGRFIGALLQARQRGTKIFFIGNGGSAATASHFANDIAIGTRAGDKPFKAISLTDNVAVLTALGNDDGYEHIFTRQLQVLASPGDILVAISASGNSPNVILAAQWAKRHGLQVVGLTGFDGGQLMALSDIRVHVATRKGEYGPVEDVHMVVDHLVGSYLIRAIRVATVRESAGAFTTQV